VRDEGHVFANHKCIKCGYIEAHQHVWADGVCAVCEFPDPKMINDAAVEICSLSEGAPNWGDRLTEIGAELFRKAGRDAVALILLEIKARYGQFKAIKIFGWWQRDRLIDYPDPVYVQLKR